MLLHYFLNTITGVWIAIHNWYDNIYILFLIIVNEFIHTAKHVKRVCLET